MYWFRVIGDSLHLFSVWFLLLILIKRKSCGSVSGKSQLLFAIVYSARYLDILTYISTYNTVFKINYIACNYIISLLILAVFRESYRYSQDTFLTELLIVPSFLLALLFNYGMELTEILWSFSIFLESVAILPQFYLIYKQREVEKSLLYYLVPLGLYKLFYIFNWIYRCYQENHFDTISNYAGYVYVFCYTIALIGFCTFSIKVTNDGVNLLEPTKFFIRNTECNKKKPRNEETVSSENIAVEKV